MCTPPSDGEARRLPRRDPGPGHRRARAGSRDLPWRAVRHARVAGGEPLPLFEELLEAFPEARWNVDVKAEPALRAPARPDRAAPDAWDRVCVGSFSEARVARAQRLAGPRLATSLRHARRGRPAAAPRPRGAAADRLLGAAVRRSACAHRCPSGSRASLWSTAASARRARARAAGPRLDGQRRRSDGGAPGPGVDGIMTDHIETLRTVLTERGCLGLTGPARRRRRRARGRDDGRWAR